MDLINQKSVSQMVNSTMERYGVTEEKAVEYIARALFDGDVIYAVLEAIHDEWRYDNKRGVK